MNYLESIQHEFSRGRGKTSLLSPLDWNQAGQWEKSGVPLHIVLGAMADGFKKFAGQNRKGEIGSIRYFIPMVNKDFADWQTSQVGKSAEPILKKIPFIEEDNMPNAATKQFSNLSDENIEMLDNIAAALMPDVFERQRVTLPELLVPAVAKLRGEILALLDDTTQKQLTSSAIETRLEQLKADFNTAIIASVSEEECARILKDVKEEYGKFQLMPDVEKKTLIYKLYKKFSLPEITLYAF